MSRDVHRVAIVVFCEAEGVDEHDAATAAEMALAHALSGGTLRQRTYARLGASWPVEVGFIRPRDDLEVTARVVRIVEAGMALGNGYLWTRTTSKAFREGGA